MIRNRAIPLILFILFETAARSGDRPRVYVEDSRTWTLNGWSPFTGLLGAFGGGDRPLTVEILHTFTKRCPQVAPVREREGSDFAVLIEREGGKGLWRKDNKYAVFAKSGELIASGSTRILGNAVTEACQAIQGKSSE
jgi:hypothetical protein